MRHWLRLLLIFLAISSLTLVGCSTPQANSSSSATETTQTTQTEQTTITANNSSQTMSNLPRLEGKATVVMTVKGSPITIKVNGEDAPITAGNFVDLVKQGVYDGLVFHRVVKEPQPFVAQGGDPQGKDPNFPVARLGTGGFIDPATNEERRIPLEIKPEGADEPIYSKTFKQAKISVSPALRHTRGAVAMARSQAPDSASSQFYFALADLPFLDGDYAVFGYINEGMNIVDQIQQGDRIESAEVTAGIENLKQ